MAVAVTGTVEAALSALPSFTTKVATYTPTVSGTKVGLDVVDKSKTVELPVGLVDNTHLYVKVSPSASVLAVPFSVTVAVTVTVWAVPALATGAVLAVAAVTRVVDTTPFTLPSFTIRLAT